jgi:hypothetical protein
MKIKVLLLTLLISSCSLLIDKVIKVDNSLYNYKERQPVQHEGHYDPITDTGRWINYLAIDLKYSPIKNIRKELEAILKVDLSITEKKRGKEAHLTVITPPEYWQLHSHLRMQEINQVFLKRVQSLDFRVLCVARAQVEDMQTFFFVAESEQIVGFRKEIHKLFVKNGGDPGAFDPTSYYPHITIGFNIRDLHEKDDIYKSDSHCIGKIQDKYTLDEEKWEKVKSKWQL